MKTCNDVMTKSPTCCVSDDSLIHAANVMKSDDVGAVPVVESHEEPRLIGMITDRDIVVRALAGDKEVHSLKVRDVMSHDPVSCRPEDPLQDAMDKMAQHQIRRLPIVDGRGCVSGIISQADIATRVSKPKRTAELVEEISQPVG